ncbi:Uncharacterised protein [Salmonella enterica subsp. arizonae]|nr:Uncharacterised protein [Salmonella enterica subsp. arizonae]
MKKNYMMVEKRLVTGAGETFETTVTPERPQSFRRQESHMS